MGRRRFARLQFASQLEVAALDRYRAYRAGTVQITRGQQPNRPSEPVQITPFGFDLAGTTKAAVDVTTRSRLALSAEIGTRAVALTADGEPIAGFIPAKVVAFFGTGTSVQATSEITLRTYQRAGGESYTHPFGGATATEKEYEAFRTIAAAISATPNTSVSSQPERRYAI